mgnify:CR=1 FL=1
MKILLAEDDINLGKLLSMLLKKQNITVKLGYRMARLPTMLCMLYG